MAKFKLNLKGDWKSLAIAHGEKVGLAVVGVVVLLFLWSALGQEGLPDSQGPQALQSLTEQAKNHIARSHWEEYPQRPALPPIGLQSTMKPLELAPYKTRVAYDPPLWPKKVKRADPQLFTAIELEVHSGYAPFALRDPNAERAAAESTRPTKRPGGGLFGGAKPRDGGLFGDPAPAGGLVDDPNTSVAEKLSRPLPAWFEAGGVHPGSADKIEGRRWVVVTALVPVAKQQDEYERVFQDAEGYEPQADVPHYFGYFIERAEVNPSAQPTWQQIDVVSERKLATLKGDWGGGENLDEVADERYVHRDFTYPLGPRVLTDWDVEVIHSKTPRAPTREELEAMQAAEQAAEPEPEPEKKEEEFDPLNDLGVTGRRPSDATEASPNSRTPVRRPVAAPRRGAGDPSDETGGRLALPPAPFYLLRYFDFNVEPGKKYQYRVRLAMRDPNYERSAGGGSGETLQRVPNKFLEQAVIDRFNAQPVEAKRKVRFTDWSAPSPVIEPLVEQGVLAAEVSAPYKGRFNDRPSGTLLVKNFDFRTGMEVVAERTLARAGTTNFVADLEAIDPLRLELTKLKQYPVAVDATLVDLRGGEKLGTRDAELTAPGEFLVLDPLGNLQVHDEIDDRLEVENIRGFLQEEAAPAEGALFDGLGAAPPEDEGGLLGPTPNGRSRRPTRPVRQPRTPRNAP